MAAGAPWRMSDGVDFSRRRAAGSTGHEAVNNRSIFLITKPDRSGPTEPTSADSEPSGRPPLGASARRVPLPRSAARDACRPDSASRPPRARRTRRTLFTHAAYLHTIGGGRSGRRPIQYRRRVRLCLKPLHGKQWPRRAGERIGRRGQGAGWRGSPSHPPRSRRRANGTVSAGTPSGRRRQMNMARHNQRDPGC